MESQIPKLAETAKNRVLVPPWEQADAFPEKPKGQDYGFCLDGKLVQCASREELIELCRRQGAPATCLVWHPQAPRLVPASEVRFLSVALQERQRSQCKKTAVVGGINTVVFGGLTLLFWKSPSWSWIFCLLLAIGVILLLNGLYSLLALGQASGSDYECSVSAGRYRAWVVSRGILFTWVLLAALSGVFILAWLHGFSDAEKLAGLDKPAVWRGQWWRLLTGPLLPGNGIHFLFAAAALIALGRFMEVLASRYYLALVFFTAALAGSVCSLFLQPDTPSVGAGGGLLGLAGFLAVLGIQRKHFLPPGFAKSIAAIIALLAAMEIVAHPFMDDAANLGGLLAGLVLGGLLINPRTPILPLRTPNLVRTAGLVMLLTTLTMAGYSMVRLWR
jgi:membrane associated rhomboid family serine protease